MLAGGGPEEAALRERLGDAGDVPRLAEGDALAAAYASADLFMFCSQTDTYGQVLLEAQASGLPVVAVAAGGPAELVAHGRSGLLCSARPGRARRSPWPGSRAPRPRAGGSPAAACGRSRRAPGRRRSAASRRAGSSRSPASAPPRARAA